MLGKFAGFGKPILAWCPQWLPLVSHRVLLMAAVAVGSVRGSANDLLCNICLDIVTDIDSWITSDTTEDQIVDWMHMICEVS